MQKNNYKTANIFYAHNKYDIDDIKIAMENFHGIFLN